jgi:hypothetical protein
MWTRVVSQCVEALRRKTGGPRLDLLWGSWKFSSDLILLSAFSRWKSLNP